jgi:hypothetical protein
MIRRVQVESVVPLSTQAEAWNEVRAAYGDYMYHESVERGYDADAAGRALNIYRRESDVYERRFNEKWNAEDTRFNAPAPAGHNGAPVTEDELFQQRMAEEHAALLAEADKLATARAKSCDTEEYAQRLANYIKKINGTVASLEKIREKEKAPSLKTGRIIDGYFNAIKTALNEAKERATIPLTAYQKKKRDDELRAAQVAADKMRAEAEAQRVAADAMQENMRPHEAAATYKAADAIEKHAAHIENKAVSGAVRTGGATAVLSSRWVCDGYDIHTLDIETLRHCFTPEAVNKAISAFINSGGRTLKGAKIIEQTKGSVR